jgi:heat shock protein HtpX
MSTRLLLFFLTNLLVIATLSALVTALGLDAYLDNHGIKYEQMIYFCFAWGMGGSCIALLLSRLIAKLSMGVIMINPAYATKHEQALLDLVRRLSQQAGLKTPPAVGIYRSHEVNAFATGPSQRFAMIAVSSGLLKQMKQDELEAILAHEIAHIANGDMVTMMLLQGVVNAFSLFLSRITVYAISCALSYDQEKPVALSSMTQACLTLLFDMIFTLLGSLLVAAFSRWREYRADHGGAGLVGQNKMVAALQRLHQITDVIPSEPIPAIATMMITARPGWTTLFSTHPSFSERIKRLQAA